MIKPNLFIVGAPKCGTTAMNDYLANHPDIFMGPKELHYFGKDLKMKARLSEREYLQHFQEGESKKIIGDASVWYLFSKTAAVEIKQFSPHAKILIMLRNPVDVIHSLHSQNLYDGNEDILDFKKAISLDEERKKGKNLPNAVGFLELPPYIDSVLFYEQVKRYMDVFGTTNVHIILYDELVANTKRVVAETFSFLGLNPCIELKTEVINPNKRIKFFFLHRILKNPPQRVRKFIRLILPFKSIRHMMMTILFKWNIRVGKRGRMDYNLKKKLQQELASDIALLNKLINRDLSNWC